MNRKNWTLAMAGALLVALLPGLTSATTRDLANLQPTRLSFDQSILNQLTYDTYRDPFDELQTRPYNLLFNNIGRHPNLSPWQGQEGSYTRYLNALIGNNGAANVDNDADSIQGALIRRERSSFAWGLSAAFLSGNEESNDSNATTTFVDVDDLTGFDLRPAFSLQVSENKVIGGGARLTQATRDVSSSSFEAAVGGFFGADEFDETGILLDMGLRHFISSGNSWEIYGAFGVGSAEKNEFSETIDDTGVATDRLTIKNYEISDINVGLYGGYNKLKSGKLGETEYRGGIELSQRELDNTNLSFFEDAGGVTPSLTLLAQDTVSATHGFASFKTIIQAGETEMFTGARIGFTTVSGGTQVDSAGVIVNEDVDDSQMHLGVTVGLRQPLFTDKIRIVISGHADVINDDRMTIFDTASVGDQSTLSSANYAIGLEGVLANVTFDIAWLSGEEAPVTTVPLGLPSGSRRSVVADRFVFSAGVAW